MTTSTTTDPAETPGSDFAADERLSADDLASRLEGQALASALAKHRTAAAGLRRQPGICANCSETCLPLAVYCDDECRGEHERRVQILRRQGRSA